MKITDFVSSQQRKIIEFYTNHNCVWLRDHDNPNNSHAVLNAFGQINKKSKDSDHDCSIEYALETAIQENELVEIIYEGDIIALQF